MARSKNRYGLESFGISDEEFERQYREATRRGKEELKYAPRAVGVSAKKGLITVTLSTGWSFTFDPRKFKWFRGLTDRQLAEVEPLGQGFAIEWPKLDLEIGVGNLIYDLLGPKFVEMEAARRRGEVTSERKKTTSRANGKLGGRPKKSDK